MKTKLQFWYIRLHRYLLKTKYLKIMSGPLKGLLWTTSMNYEYITGSYIGEDEQAVIKDSLAMPDSCFYDVGANVGYFSLCVAKLVPACKIFAFEPMPQHVASLKKHVELNNVPNISINEMAVADHSGELIFTDVENSEGNTYKNESALFKNSTKTVKVQGVSIDDFVAKGNKAPDLLKIDVEGAELDVLHGAVKTISTYKPVILLATHDCHVPGIKEKCLEFMHQINYTTSVIGAHNKHVPGLEDFLAVPKA